MSDITVIIARTYAYGMAWLRLNHKRYALDPQKCRICTNPFALKGLSGYRLVLVKGWRANPKAKEFQQEILDADIKGRIKEKFLV